MKYTFLFVDEQFATNNNPKKCIIALGENEKSTQTFLIIL